MRILMITRLFEPLNVIGAVRPTQFCKGLAELGHEVYCVTEGTDSDSSTINNPLFSIRRVKTSRFGDFFKRFYHSAAPQKKKEGEEAEQLTKKTTSPLKAKLRYYGGQIVKYIDEFFWAKKAFKVVNEIFNEKKFDCIISDFGPESAVMVGYWLKKRNIDLLWISDLRDPMIMAQEPGWKKFLNRKLEKNMIKSADEIICVSEDLKNKYIEKCNLYNIKANLHVFVNGYIEKEELNNKNIQKEKPNDVFNIVYTGTIHPGKSKMDVLFDVLLELSEAEDTKIPVKVHYAGHHSKAFLDLARQKNCLNFVEDHGFITREEAQELQAMADVLCVLTWNTAEEQGVLTGKFPEYLRLQKSILALVSGEVPNAEISRRIAELNIGYSYEYCSGLVGVDKLKTWLWDCIRKKTEGIRLLDELNTEILYTYDYSNIVNDLSTFLLASSLKNSQQLNA